ncbi:MAG TPA: RNA-binding S4 domain-containing protein [Hyphomicrobium sp.]|nr:RNA-binding S4 domain-containing protein [Hyphomicrobium sp.]
MPQPEGTTPSLRIDQWLWFARIAKSRTLAQALIERGKVRINRVRIDKSSQQVKPGDVITIALGPKVRVLQVSALGNRRGPATEAAQLYAELTPPAGPARRGVVTIDRDSGGSAQVEGAPGEQPAGHAPGLAPGLAPGPSGVRPRGAGRPTKRDRRAIDRLKGGG